jgi:HSP20 family protein
MNIVQYSPNRWLESAVNRVFSDFGLDNTWEASAPQAAFNPRVEIREDKDALIVSAEIPGVEKDKLTVEVNDGVLTLSGSKVQEAVSDENSVYRAERIYGEFKRGFVLPDNVDAAKIDAEFRNGVLKVTLPKKPEAAPKQISIRGQDAKQVDVN